MALNMAGYRWFQTIPVGLRQCLLYSHRTVKAPSQNFLFLGDIGNTVQGYIPHTSHDILLLDFHIKQP